MDKFLDIYINEIFLQKNFALQSYNKFIDSLDTQKSPKNTLYHIHHFLVHTSNIIKILFPKDNPKNQDNIFIQERAKKLRENFNLSENDFNIHQINLRNDLEHYDERIDFWVKNSKQHAYCDIGIISAGAIKGIDTKDMFRTINPQSKIFTFCGKEYDLQYLKNFIDKKIKQNIT